MTMRDEIPRRARRAAVAAWLTFGVLGCGTAARTQPECGSECEGAPPAPLIPVAVSAGTTHTCAVTPNGGSKCWGDNAFDELGNTGTSGSLVPLDVAGLSAGVVSVAAGNFSTCAVTAAGAIQCWGSNDTGQLGDGSSADSATPVDVVGLSSGVVASATGEQHACALTSAGGVKCWGSSGYDQLGDGSTTGGSPVPVDVSGLSSDVLAISAGLLHTCAVTTEGGVKCWGFNHRGQLGDGGTAASPVPVGVMGLSSGVTAVAAGGAHTCAVTTEGGVKCWGFNNHGQLGDGTTTDSAAPVDVVGLSSGVAAVSAHADHTCAVTRSGALRCWGWNAHGELGTGSTTDSAVPLGVVSLRHGVLAVSTGEAHTCAVTLAGTVHCWGENQYGQLGDGSTGDSLVPVAVTDL